MPIRGGGDWLEVNGSGNISVRWKTVAVCLALKEVSLTLYLQGAH